MKKESIKSHLSPFSIFKKRQTTVNHAFASAIAPNGRYKEGVVVDAIKFLGQDPDKDLFCAYCGNPAETWDHVFNLVKKFRFSGYGHVVGNLLPCCKRCNSKKGNKNWLDFLKNETGNKKSKQERIKNIQAYVEKYLSRELTYEEIEKICPDEIIKYERLKSGIFNLMKQADSVATNIRDKIKSYEEN